MQPQSNPARGSALIGVIIVLMITAGVSGIYLQTSTKELQYTHNLALRQHAINIGEAGAELAIDAMNRDDWIGWTTVDNGYERQYTIDSALVGGQSIARTANVRIENPGTASPRIFAEGRVSRGQLAQQRQIRIELGKRTPFDNGLTARGRIRFKGNNTNVDSYNSNEGDYDPDNPSDNGSVSSLSAEVDDVDIQNAKIKGFVATGGAPPKVGAQGAIFGFDSPEGESVDESRISNDFYAELSEVEAPNATYTPYDGSGTMGTDGEQTYLSSDNIELTDGETLQIQGDVVLNLTGNLKVHGEIVIPEGSSLTLYLGGNLNMAGNGSMNNSNVPSALQLYGTSDGPGADGWQNFALGGNAALKAAVYAPNANIELGGGGHTGVAMGAMVGNTITFAGNYAFHYDEALSELGVDETYRMLTWRELLNHDERVTFLAE